MSTVSPGRLAAQVILKRDRERGRATRPGVSALAGAQSSAPAATGDPFGQAVSAVFAEAQQLLLRKHSDYGPLNISQAPGGPLNGLRVRMWDKQARINNLVDTGRAAANEPLRDSLLDLLNYSAIGLLVLDGLWPGVGAPDEDPEVPAPRAGEGYDQWLARWEKGD